MTPHQPTRRQLLGSLFTGLFAWLWPGKATAMPMPAPTPIPPEPLTSTSVYDGTGCLTERLACHTVYTYDFQGRCLSVQDFPPESESPPGFRYDYDGEGRPESSTD